MGHAICTLVLMAGSVHRAGPQSRHAAAKSSRLMPDADACTYAPPQGCKQAAFQITCVWMLYAICTLVHAGELWPGVFTGLDHSAKIWAPDLERPLWPGAVAKKVSQGAALSVSTMYRSWPAPWLLQRGCCELSCRFPGFLQDFQLYCGASQVWDMSFDSGM